MRLPAAPVLYGSLTPHTQKMDAFGRVRGAVERDIERAQKERHFLKEGRQGRRRTLRNLPLPPFRASRLSPGLVDSAPSLPTGGGGGQSPAVRATVGTEQGRMEGGEREARDVCVTTAAGTIFWA